MKTTGRKTPNAIVLKSKADAPPQCLSSLRQHKSTYYQRHLLELSGLYPEQTIDQRLDKFSGTR